MVLVVEEGAGEAVKEQMYFPELLILRTESDQLEADLSLSA
jgi:hypothetical protein